MPKKNLHKGKSSTGPKSNGSKTPMMTWRTSAPFLRSNNPWIGVFDGWETVALKGSLIQPHNK